MIRAFIFDLDGVITDTAEYHYRGWRRLADEEGIPFTREDNEHLRGVPRRESLMLILINTRGLPVSRPSLSSGSRRTSVWSQRSETVS